MQPLELFWHETHAMPWRRWNLALAQPAISSQLIDNLNASIHLRALLTDLFLIDEILKVNSQPFATQEPAAGQGQP